MATTSPTTIWEACIDKVNCHGRSTLSCEVLNMPHHLRKLRRWRYHRQNIQHSCPLSKAEWVLDGRLYAEIAIPIHLVAHPPPGVRAPRTHWAHPHQPGPSPGKRLDSLDCWTEKDFKKGKVTRRKGFFFCFCFYPIRRKFDWGCGSRRFTEARLLHLWPHRKRRPSLQLQGLRQSRSARGTARERGQ